MHGKPLAAVVRVLMKDASWGDVRKAISARKVQVNGNLCLDDARPVKKGDLIRIHLQSLAPLPDSDTLIIRHLDPHLIVVEKPAGLISTRHADEDDLSIARRGKQPTLDELLPAALANKLPPTKQTTLQRPPLPTVIAVHRLDRDTSGLMVFARTRAAEQKLVQMFAAHEIQRLYQAVVTGYCPAMTVRSFLYKHPATGKRQSLPPDATEQDIEHFRAKLAVTHVRPLRNLGPYFSLVECRLETGRTHQIRIHLSESGHMIAGDKIYRTNVTGQPFNDSPAGLPPPPRQVLHSTTLSFLHPITGQKLHFDMPMPKDLARWIASVEHNSKK